jgi:sigma-B regulation protein RsbU (phosphoserine phosphatase)
MAFFSKSQRTRRSLLASQRTNEPTSFRKKLLIVNIMMLAIVVFTTLRQADEISMRALPDLLRKGAFAELFIGTLANLIAILAHFGSVWVRRYTATRSTAIRMLAEGGVMMVSSAIVIGILLLFNSGHVTVQGVSGPAGTVLAVVLFSVFTAVIGISVLFVKMANQWRKRQTALLSQGDLLTAEFQAARSVQQSLMPHEDAQLFGFDISGTTAPAVEIGGDYYDYLTFADGSKGVIVADASGKGIPAALLMAKFQGMAQALSIHVETPEEFFIGLNDTLRIRMERHRFITVGMLTIDFDNRITFYRAGHNPLILYCASSSATELLRPPGIGLGLTHGTMLGNAMKPGSFEMSNGDVALLYSDGLTEAMNHDGEEYGEERVTVSLQQASRNGGCAADIRNAVMNDLSTFVGNAEPHDDVTVVVVKKV